MIKAAKAVWASFFAVVLVAALGSSAFASVASDPNIKVVVNDRFELLFADKVRLSEVLDASLKHWRDHGLGELDIYWPGARLAMVDGAFSEQQALEQQREQVLAQLNELSAQWLNDGERERAAQAMALAQQLSSLLLAWQPFGQPEIEASRLFLEHNPLLHEGVYHLYLPEREANFYIYGLTKSPGLQRVIAQQTVRGYLKPHAQNELLWPDASRSKVFYVDHAAPAVALSWGSYNAPATHVLPGDILFLGFKEGALATNGLGFTKQQRKFAQLNKDIASLLSHWWADPSAQLMDSSIIQQVEQRVPGVSDWQRLDLSPSRSNYGGIGLMQTPTARMAPEGEMAFSYSDMKEYRRYNATLQVLPWLEANGFYVRTPSQLYSPSPEFSGDNIHTDKGFDVKVRLWQESEYVPEIAVGLSDFAGTGLFSSEYVVASKRWGPLDFTFGIGFGRLGTRDSFPNPFCEITDSYCERGQGTSGKGGKPETGKWFRGDAAYFGGVEYQTPVAGLRLKLEYEGNDYSKEYLGVQMNTKTPVNLGLMYRPFDWLDLQVSYEQGDIFSFGFVFRTNLNTMSQLRLQPDPIAAAPVAQVTLKDVHWRGLRRKMRNQYAFDPVDFAVREDADGQTVSAFMQPLRYRDGNEAIERGARVLAEALPESVHTYEFVEQGMLMPLVTTRVPAAEFRAQIANELPGRAPNAVSETFERVEAEDRPAWNDAVWRDASPYRFKPAFGVQPFFQQDFGAPETFHFYQLGLKGSMHFWLDEKTWLVTDVGVNIINNFDKFNFKVDAFGHLPLERVRTYTREYMDNDVWLDTVQLTRFERFSDTVYGMAYAGILERMYAGAGGEMLWRPLDSPLAIGLDVNWVKQRDFDGGFGLRDYSTATGFLTAYYQMPWLKDSMLQVGVGRFLARDTGAALQFQRRFESGIIVGAFANITNVSSADYGEGSFTKGVFINIPFDALSIMPNRKRLDLGWVPLSRDGGQALHRRATLYGITDARAPYFMR